MTDASEVHLWGGHQKDDEILILLRWSHIYSFSAVCHETGEKNKWLQGQQKTNTENLHLDSKFEK